MQINGKMGRGDCKKESRGFVKSKIYVIARKVALLVSLVGGIIVLWQIEVRYGEKKPAAVSTYSEIVVTQSVQNKKQEKKENKQPQVLEELEKYIKINQDVIGYITIPDTNIDYPILMGQDNEYYLQHDLNGNENKEACIMADYKYGDTDIRKEFQRHTLVYGHHMKKKTMFTSLCYYKEEEFFLNHPYIYYSNLYKTGKWRVFSVYVVNADNETIKRKFADDKKYIQYLDKIKARSLYRVDVKLDEKSKVLTLCTCSYETDNSRTIVHAVLENE